MVKAAVNYEDFDKVLETLLQDLVSYKGHSRNVPEVFARLDKVLRHSVLPNVKMSGYLLAQSYADIYGSALKPEQIHQAYILGWCWQMLQTCLLLMDQLYTGEKTQNGRPTWYHLNDQQPICINDAILVEQGTNWLLRKYFGHLPVFPELQEYFSTVSYEYFLGRSLDHDLSKETGYDMDNFTISKRLACVRKNNFKYRYSGPIQVAMILAACPKDDGLWDSVDKIGEDLAEFLAVKQDLGDMVAENPGNSNSADGDIKNGKLSWLIVKARDAGTDAQWYTIKLYYGISDMVSVATIKGLYRQLGVPKICESHMETLLAKLREDVAEVNKSWRNIGKKLESIVEFFSTKS